MNNNSAKSVVAFQYTSSNSLGILHTTENETVATKVKIDFLRIDENHKLVRRYSFDDNGGGYSGL